VKTYAKRARVSRAPPASVPTLVPDARGRADTASHALSDFRLGASTGQEKSGRDLFDGAHPSGCRLSGAFACARSRYTLTPDDFPHPPPCLRCTLRRGRHQHYLSEAECV
jgi:hypothetical protein